MFTIMPRVPAVPLFIVVVLRGDITRSRDDAQICHDVHCRNITFPYRLITPASIRRDVDVALPPLCAKARRNISICAPRFITRYALYARAADVVLLLFITIKRRVSPSSR